MRPRRRIALFLAALAVPCLLLAVLSVRMLQQDRELAGQRAAEEQRRAAEQVRKDALNQLEQIKLRVAAGPPPEHVVVVKAEPPGKPTPGAAIERGEQAEFRGNDPALAAGIYRQALAGAGQPAESAYARLLLARALHKSGQTAEAQAQWRILLDTPLEIADEYGIPFALYAGGQLHAVPPGVLDRLTALPAAALYMLRDLTSDARVAERIAWKERVEPVAANLREMAAQYPLRRAWAPFGDPPWLAGEDAGGALIAVPAADVLPAFDEAGIELGAEFPGVKVRLPAAAPAVNGSSQAFLYAAMALALAVTGLGGYLLWRDLQREVALAGLRAQFVASVSHELKTPLTAIRMFAETLRLRGAGNPRLHAEYLDTMIHESERLTRLVDNILDFSKIERGSKTYCFAPVALSEVVASAARTMQYPLSQSGFRLAVEVAAALPPVRADRDALEQAVLNLLTNAMKYSGEARDIALRLHRDNGHAVIEVEDHGIGIPAGEQARIFERFFRAATPQNHLIPGAGLGLTLTEQTARAHSGHVAVHSLPGEGSTFSIYIPLELTPS